jgi:CRP-like cAMP-binding protein
VATLVGFSVVATFVFGIDTVLFVVLSDRVLGTGSEGYGYLLTGMGVGGVLAAGVVTRLERLPRLGAVILGGMAGYCLPTLLFLTVDQPTVAFVAQVLRGASTLVVDVLAITALQRSIPSDRLGRVFGAFDGLCLLAIVAGSALVPLALDVVGLDAVLWATGLGIPVLCLLAWPWLQRMDREAVARRDALRPRTELLRRCGIFDSVSEGALEQLAGDAEEMDTITGQVVIGQGEPADALYVIDSGVFVPSAVGDDGSTLVLTAMGPGSYFGEIGLLEAIPRTATVVAEGPGRLLRVDGAAFLAALTEEAPSAAFLDGASLRLSRTHPSQRLTRAALGEDA